MSKIPEFKIEKNIPIFAKREGAKQKIQSKYPYDRLEIGDSFFVPEHIKTKKSMAAVHGYYQRNFKHKKFTRRTLAKGTRIWRTA